MTKVLIFSLLLLLGSCKTNHLSSPVTQFAANVMTIDYRILIGDPLTNDQKNKVQKTIQTTFEEINTIFNKWNPDSELSRLNRLKAGEVVPISAELESFLQKTDQIVRLTEGRFDPTIEPLQQLWKQKLLQQQEPTESEIAEILPAIGWDKIHVSDGQFYKDHDRTALDLGGIAKGYCVDLLVERLNDLGLPDVYVEWGGEIRASGQHPEHRPWHIYISRLDDSLPQHALAHLDLVNQGIATSGDYLQNWTVSNGKKTYFHIFDPKTHRPLVMTDTSIASATVLAPSCMLADGLATAAMMFPSIKEAQEWAVSIKQRYPEIQFWWFSRDESQ